jgi:hypothetical protein
MLMPLLRFVSLKLAHYLTTNLLVLFNIENILVHNILQLIV